MKFKDKLQKAVKQNNSLLCVGLDPIMDKLPTSLDGDDKIFNFFKEIVDQTADLVCGFKPQSAFFEAEGANGISQLKKICDYINAKYPEIPLILDAKRADIGSTNFGYTKYAFDYLNADAITVNPYLGGETLEPFLDRKDKAAIVLCRTSNPGAGEFQDLMVDGKKLYQIVAEDVRDKWNKNDNCMLVVGATYPKELAEIRSTVGDEIDLLVPGIGVQGAEVEATVKAGLNSKGGGMIISTSRAITFASDGADFAQKARAQAKSYRDEINNYRKVSHV